MRQPDAGSPIVVTQFQFTHPGKGATVKGFQMVAECPVSIHAPWEGCDETHNSKGANSCVSIHAPWEGCDQGALRYCALDMGFNSRTLGRVRPLEAGLHRLTLAFQFTHPGKGATVGTQQGKDINYVSIHAPWEGCDCFHSPRPCYLPSFNSRTLGRVRL